MDPIRHFELGAHDRTKLGEFYASLFGWHAEEFPEMQYVTIDTHGGAGINGGIGPAGDAGPGSSVYAEVADPQMSLDKAVSLGATVLMPVMDVPGVVTLAMFMDPSGNAIGLVKDKGETGAVGAGGNPAVTWFEILGSDPRALRDFYAALFGWEFKVSEGSGDEFEYFEVQGDEQMGGGVGSSRDGDPHVTAYAQVDDLQAYLDKAVALGGWIIMPPMDAGESVAFAQFADPEGIVFGLWRQK